MWATPASPGQDHDHNARARSDIITHGTACVLQAHPAPLQIKTSRSSLEGHNYSEEAVVVCVGDDLHAPSGTGSARNRVLYTVAHCVKEAIGIELDPKDKMRIGSSAASVRKRALKFSNIKADKSRVRFANRLEKQCVA